MRPLQPRARRPVRDAERFGHCHEGQAHVVVQDKYGALVERKPAKGLLQLVTVRDHLDVVDVAGDIGRKHAKGRCPSPVARCVRVAGVYQDSECPSLEAVRITQVRELPPDGQQGVLQHVLRENRVAEDPSRDAQQRVTDLVHQIGKRFLVAGAGSLHHLSVHGTLREVVVRLRLLMMRGVIGENVQRGQRSRARSERWLAVGASSGCPPVPWTIGLFLLQRSLKPHAGRM